MKKIKDYLLFLKQRFYAYRRAVKLDQKIIIAITVMTAAIIIVLAWIIRPNPKIEIAATQLAQTANNIRLFYQTKPGYWGLNTETVIKNNLEAGGMLIDGKLQNAFGKSVIIGEDEQGSIIMPGTRHFTVTFPELNKSECTVMAAFRLNERESLSLLQMIISNGEQRYEFNWGGSNPLPITKQDAAKYCGKNNIVSWRFE